MAGGERRDGERIENRKSQVLSLTDRYDRRIENKLLSYAHRYHRSFVAIVGQRIKLRFNRTDTRVEEDSGAAAAATAVTIR